MRYEVIQVIAFLHNRFPGGVQMFNTRNIMGDYMEVIYICNSVTVEYAPGYNYVEIFGLTQAEFDYVDSKCGSH